MNTQKNEELESAGIAAGTDTAAASAVASLWILLAASIIGGVIAEALGA